MSVMEVYNALETLAPQHGQQASQLNYGAISRLGSGTYFEPSQQHYHYHNCCNQLGFYQPVQPHDTQIVIELICDEIKLNYGGKLRLLIADPVKGQDLREAISKLKIALKEAVLK
jgi:hypothetical protein